jgi:hypothetical protein
LDKYLKVQLSATSKSTQETRELWEEQLDVMPQLSDTQMMAHQQELDYHQAQEKHSAHYVEQQSD